MSNSRVVKRLTRRIRDIDRENEGFFQSRDWPELAYGIYQKQVLVDRLILARQKTR